MRLLRVYDPPMCCSTGVCGPSFDPSLARFAADIVWLASKDVKVERLNLAHQPAEFLSEPQVASRLSEEGFLPAVVFNGELLSHGAYPDRRAIALALGLDVPLDTKRLNLIGN